MELKGVHRPNTNSSCTAIAITLKTKQTHATPEKVTIPAQRAWHTFSCLYGITETIQKTKNLFLSCV